MNITLSKKQWEKIGKTAGWFKVAVNTVNEIIGAIKSGNDPYFGVSHFHASNMQDYTIMSSTIKDMIDVYGINEQEASDIIMALTHGEEVQEEDIDLDQDLS